MFLAVFQFRSSFLSLLVLLYFIRWIPRSSSSEAENNNPNADRLKLFYERIKKSDVKYCEDRTKLLPSCTECIPGLQAPSNGQSSCSEFIPSSKAIRDEIKQITDTRYGHNPVADRPFGLYPYLERPDFMLRQLTFGKMLSTKALRHVMDIGAYYNPIHLFFAPNVCPESVIIIEPILDPLSLSVPCNGAENDGKSTHVMFLPITFKHYISISQQQPELIPRPDTVVCIGCDSHYGPNRNMLETSFPRPYSLYLEYPSDYVHNQPFKKMNGNGQGEEMTYIHKFQPKTNETMYTKRVMKVIEYK